MRILIITLAALTSLFAVAPASANGFNLRPRSYHGGPPPGACGSAYVGNRYGGTVYANLPDCDRSRAYTGPFPYRRNWVTRPATIRTPAYGGYYGGGEFGGGYSRSHRRIVIIHRTHREWRRTVHAGGGVTRTITRGNIPAVVTARDVAILRSVYGE